MYGSCLRKWRYKIGKSERDHADRVLQVLRADGSIYGDDDLTDPQAQEIATMNCSCDKAVEYQKEKKRKENALKNVSKLFGEDAHPDKRVGEDIVNIMMAAVEEIYTGGLAKVTLNLRGGVKASVSQNAKGEINVERIETKKQKLTE